MNCSKVIALGTAGTAAALLFWQRRHFLPAYFFDVQEERVIKRVLFCRHGQGHHNTKDEHGEHQLQIFDPELTSKGVAEARAIFADFPQGRLDFKPDMVLVSPLWRTLQTATEAMRARSDGHSCPIIAMEEIREHNNLNACNYRRPIQMEHFEAFQSVDFSEIAVDGPPPKAEWATPYKRTFGILRRRAKRALEAIHARPEERIAVFSHASFIRAVLSEVLQLGPHHAAKGPRTGQAVEVWCIETPGGDKYWEMRDNREDGQEVLNLAWRTDNESDLCGERDDGARP